MRLLAAFATLIFLAVPNDASLAVEVQTAAGQSSDRFVTRQDLKATISHNILWDEAEQFGTTIAASSDYAHIERKSNDSALLELWDHKKLVHDVGTGFSLGQDFYKRLGVGLNYYRHGSQIGFGTSRGISTYLWLLSETLQLSYAFTYNDEVLRSMDVIDADAVRVLTRQEINGNVHKFGVTQLTSTVSQWDLAYTRILRNDRPPADAVNLWLRYFVKPSNSGLHIGLNYFQNIGEIRPYTLQGEVRAYALQGEVHQRVLEQFALMTGYRYYIERENPRAENATDRQLGSDYLYGRLIYRYDAELWVKNTSEIFIFGGWYRSSLPMQARTVGIGSKLVL